MGIRFSCHGCGKPLNIKNELAGRRGVCPECQIRFRIPSSDAEYSTPIATGQATEQTELSAVGAKSVEASSQHADRVSSPQQPSVRQDTAGEQEAEEQTAEEQNAMASAADEDSALKSSAQPSMTSKAERDSANLPTESQSAGSPIAENVADNARSTLSPDDGIELLSNDPTATWYVRPPSGGQYGPADGNVLRSWITEGRVAKTALLWRDGWPQWREASEALPEIAERLPGAIKNEPQAPFSDGHDPSKLTTPLSREKTSPINPNLSGDAKIGASRRKRSSRRIALVAILATLVIGLIVTLVLVASTGQ